LDPVKELKFAYRAIRTIENWYEIPTYYLGMKKSLIIKLRNGLRFKYEPDLFGAEVFLDEPYKKLNVEGKDVIDIGAFNADSALYFALRGARRVIAFEPFPRIYRLALENLRLNNFPNVTILNEAVSSSNGIASINTGAEKTGSNNQLVETVGDFIVQKSTLGSLVERFHLNDACLKIDCEGSEYDILLSCDQKFLDAFSQIILEYHQGLEKLEDHLRACGFSTEILEQFNKGDGIGMLYAKRVAN
jgi:FkbM family methyltransferase